MIILGIETSCDETSASIINDGKLVANVVYTQEIHKKYGGVVPEIASQYHLNEIIDVIDSALDKIKFTKKRFRWNSCHLRSWFNGFIIGRAKLC